MSYRIYLFTRSIALTCFLATLTLVSFTGGLCSGVKALRMRKDVNAFQHKNRVLLGVTLGLEVGLYWVTSQSSNEPDDAMISFC